MEELRLIYDFTQRSPRIGIMILLLLLVLVGIAIFLYSKNIVNKSATSTFGVNKRKQGMFVAILFILFGGLIFTIEIQNNLIEYWKTSKIYTGKTYNIVQGKVNNFYPMPEGGHDTERFTVENVLFEYSDYDLTDYGYNNTSSKGGVIKEGLYVRILYFNNGSRNVIIRLETE
jgi:hypothetical protein